MRWCKHRSAIGRGPSAATARTDDSVSVPVVSWRIAVVGKPGLVQQPRHHRRLGVAVAAFATGRNEQRPSEPLTEPRGGLDPVTQGFAGSSVRPHGRAEDDDDRVGAGGLTFIATVSHARRQGQAEETMKMLDRGGASPISGTGLLRTDPGDAARRGRRPAWQAGSVRGRRRDPGRQAAPQIASAVHLAERSGAPSAHPGCGRGRHRAEHPVLGLARSSSRSRATRGLSHGTRIRPIGVWIRRMW